MTYLLHRIIVAFNNFASTFHIEMSQAETLLFTILLKICASEAQAASEEHIPEIDLRQQEFLDVMPFPVYDGRARNIQKLDVQCRFFGILNQTTELIPRTSHWFPWAKLVILMC